METVREYRISLTEKEWQSQKQVHERRVSDALHTYFVERERGHKEPVLDFLFEYYRFRFSHLKRWSPGAGYRLLDADVNKTWSPPWSATDEGVCLSVLGFPSHRREGLAWVLNVLRHTQSAKPFLGCNGLHEWAMVYKCDRPRHPYLPFRLRASEINAVVESMPIRCSHYDAFRFFTPKARAFNAVQPSRAAFAEYEQPACLHTNMDLYRFSNSFFPWVSSGLIWDCFLLAWDIRKVDMSASPYDLRDFGYAPICIETREGQAEYRWHQMRFMERGLALRKKLISILEKLVVRNNIRWFTRKV